MGQRTFVHGAVGPIQTVQKVSDRVPVVVEEHEELLKVIVFR